MIGEEAVDMGMLILKDVVELLIINRSNSIKTMPQIIHRIKNLLKRMTSKLQLLPVQDWFL